jgi:transcriptional regulator with XRE-family HTH domain
MVAVRLPSLSKKLGYLYAYSGLNQRSLAERLGLSESTVSGWRKGTKTSQAEKVSGNGREKLAAILVEQLGGVADMATARKLWLGDETEFSRALHASSGQRFLDVLATAKRRKMLTYLSGAAVGNRLVTFFEPSEMPRDAVRATVGECFAFSLAADPGRQIVLLVESAVGCHLGVPGPGAPSRLDSSGGARLPDFPGQYRFDEPKGLHRFLAFAIKAVGPLSITACAGRQTPLAETDFEVFAVELCDKLRVRSWVLDILLVDVR